MTVNQLPKADHIIVLGKEGQILEQGTFSNLSTSGSYVQSLEINQKKEQLTGGSDSQSGLGEQSVSPPTQTTRADSEENRQTGDWTIYKYYTASLGWLSLIVFANFIAAYSTFGALQCKIRPRLSSEISPFLFYF